MGRQRKGYREAASFGGRERQITTQLGAPIDVSEFACGCWLRGDDRSMCLVLIELTYEGLQVARSCTSHGNWERRCEEMGFALVLSNQNLSHEGGRSVGENAR